MWQASICRVTGALMIIRHMWPHVVSGSTGVLVTLDLARWLVIRILGCYSQWHCDKQILRYRDVLDDWITMTSVHKTTIVMRLP